MAKVYKLSDSPDVTDVEQETITVTEEKTVTESTRTSITSLRNQYASYVQQIDLLKTEANKVVDLMVELDANLEDLSLTNIPPKLV